ncbi:MAG: hypothetical protein JWM93_532 [Frankiales bacterium]|nr:hypothetical protein [Frankiales bacterium]
MRRVDRLPPFPIAAPDEAHADALLDGLFTLDWDSLDCAGHGLVRPDTLRVVLAADRDELIDMWVTYRRCARIRERSTPTGRGRTTICSGSRPTRCAASAST